MEQDMDDESCDEDDEIDSEGIHYLYNSPLENQCPILLMEEVLHGISKNEPDFFKGFIECLDMN